MRDRRSQYDMARLESGSKEMARSPLPYSKEPFLYCSKEILDIFKIKWPFSEEKLIYRGGWGLL